MIRKFIMNTTFKTNKKNPTVSPMMIPLPVFLLSDEYTKVETKLLLKSSGHLLGDAVFGSKELPIL